VPSADAEYETARMAASSRANERATVGASSFQILTMLVPRMSVSVASSRLSTAARSPSGDPPIHSAP
jgi:hypothetical protein